MFGKYSVNNLVSEFHQNRHKIYAFASGKCVECYNGNNEDDNKILGLSIGLFLFIFVIALSIWIWALVALVQNWNNLSDIAKIFAVLALTGILGGPVVTLIIVYVMRKGKPSSVEVPMKNLKYKMNGVDDDGSPYDRISWKTQKNSTAPDDGSPYDRISWRDPAHRTLAREAKAPGTTLEREELPVIDDGEPYDTISWAIPERGSTVEDMDSGKKFLIPTKEQLERKQAKEREAFLGSYDKMISDRRAYGALPDDDDAQYAKAVPIRDENTMHYAAANPRLLKKQYPQYAHLVYTGP